jgi:hypothetical protein
MGFTYSESLVLLSAYNATTVVYVLIVCAHQATHTTANQQFKSLRSHLWNVAEGSRYDQME